MFGCVCWRYGQSTKARVFLYEMAFAMHVDNCVVYVIIQMAKVFVHQTFYITINLAGDSRVFNWTSKLLFFGAAPILSDCDCNVFIKFAWMQIVCESIDKPTSSRRLYLGIQGELLRKKKHKNIRNDCDNLQLPKNSIIFPSECPLNSRQKTN